MKFAAAILFLITFNTSSALVITTPKPAKSTTSKKSAYNKAMAKAKKSAASKSRKRVVASRWKEPTYADSTVGDHVEGEDLEVRRAAIDALGPMNGSVTVVDPNTGRILSVVNQKVALKGGYTPCSTVKIYIAMAALSEGLMERQTPIRINRRLTMNLTDALAKSDNTYFAHMGQQLGFDRVVYYGKLFGLGERATLGWDAEVPGKLPTAPPGDGVGMMSSFGHGIQLSPLQLAASLAAIANGGTLYYLQYPQTQQEAANFVPRIKRRLDIEQFIPEVKPGMMGAVEYGTARRVGQELAMPILGKTGTCTDTSTPTHLGWFGSISDNERNKLVVVVLLTGGKPINGPVASGVAGQIYKKLQEARWFDKERLVSPITMVR